MDICKLFLVRLLDGLSLEDNRKVEVLTEFPPGETLPAITMSRFGGEYKETIGKDSYTPLPANHSYYDKDKSDELCNQERLWFSSFKTSILLHIWTHSNDERDKIIIKVWNLLLWNRHGALKDRGSVNLRNINGVTDLDQFELHPVLYHSTISLDFIYYLVHREKVNPLLSVEIKEKIG
jgi:hypothetical protein